MYPELRKQLKERDIRADINVLEDKIRKAKFRKRLVETELENLENDIYKWQEQVCDMEEEIGRIKYKGWV